MLAGGPREISVSGFASSRPTRRSTLRVSTAPAATGAHGLHWRVSAQRIGVGLSVDSDSAGWPRGGRRGRRGPGPGPATLVVAFASPTCRGPRSSWRPGTSGSRRTASSGRWARPSSATAARSRTGWRRRFWAARLPGARGHPVPAGRLHLGGRSGRARLAVRARVDDLSVLEGPGDHARRPLHVPGRRAARAAQPRRTGVRVVGGWPRGRARASTGCRCCSATTSTRTAPSAWSCAAPDIVTVVSQGCAPIGLDMVITAAEGLRRSRSSPACRR